MSNTFSSMCVETHNQTIEAPPWPNQGLNETFLKNGDKVYEHIVWSGRLQKPLQARSIASKLGSEGQST